MAHWGSGWGWAALVLVVGGAPLAARAASPIRVTGLRCEYAVNPIGLDETAPRLSWILESSVRNQGQTAYQIRAASSVEKLRAGQADMWDSGRVGSGQSIQVVYAGKTLSSRMRCHWQVRVWDRDGEPSEYSAPAYWEMGLLEPRDWQARWIGHGPIGADADGWRSARWIWYPEGNPAAEAPRAERHFRRGFVLPAQARIRQATLRMSADDQFEVFLNGQAAGRSSGQKDAWRALTVLDVTRHLRPGSNLLAVAVTNQGSAAGLLARLTVDLESGDAVTLATEGSWRAANRRAEGWELAGFDDRSWPAAQEVAAAGEGPWKALELTSMGPAPFLRRTFRVRPDIQQARLYATALGVYECYLNGKRVGEDVFNPGWTDYHRRVQYHTYDVTSLLAPGDNAIGVILGDGWYAGYVGLGGRNRYGQSPVAAAQLEVLYADGSRESVSTDGSWKAAEGPIRQSDMLMGEIYDARLEMPGWDRAGFDDAGWKPVIEREIAVSRVAAVDEPARKTEELETREVTEPGRGVFVFDLGQNMVGWARLKGRAPAGTTVTLRFAEMLNPDGTIYTTNLRGARCTDQYVFKGGGEEVYEPRFTFHGFRYVEMTGYPGRPEAEAITGVVVHSDTPAAGTFACSHAGLNQLQSNIRWGQRGNFLSVPTDCPQRDERLGWMGDAQIFIRTATFNMDVARFFTKWCQDVEDAQRPDGAFTDVSPAVAAGAGTAAWGDAGVICPWTVYRVYGDTRILERRFESGARWIEYMRKNSRELLRPAQGYGDWLSLQADTPKDLLATAYFAGSTRVMSSMARVLGREEDARKYASLYDEIRRAFIRAYWGADGRLKGDTQTAYVLALYFGLLSEDRTETAVRRLVGDIEARGGHLSTGFVGTGHLMPVLAAAGQWDAAYRLLTTETYPSWLFSVNQGATTIWERWDGWTPDRGFQDPGMNSFNHYSFGAVGAWMYEVVGGIGLDPSAPAFKHFLVRPRPGGGLTWARAEFISMHGKIVSDWKIEGGRFHLRVVVPANTMATIFVPSLEIDAIREENRPVAESGDLQYLGSVEGASAFLAGSGEYRFTAPRTNP